MLKLIKYDFKTDWKKILAILVSIIVSNIFILLIWHRIGRDGSIGLIVFINYGAAVLSMIMGAFLLTRYTNKDAGYLFFTLPQSGFKILTSRIISALIENFVVSFTGLIVGCVAAKKIDSKLNIHPDAFSGLTYFKILIFAIAVYIACMNIIYFAIVVSKVTIKNKKIGGVVAFIVYILIAILEGITEYYLTKAFPQSLIIKASKTYSNPQFLHYLKINISGILFETVLFVVLFSSSIKLIEKKLNL